MSRTKQSVNTTHRKRLARRYAEVTGLPYQQSLDAVIAAAEAGALPTPLDTAGMDAAVQAMTAHTFTAIAHTGSNPASGTASTTAAHAEALLCAYCHEPLRYEPRWDLLVPLSADVDALMDAEGHHAEPHDVVACPANLRRGGLTAFVAAGWHYLGALIEAAETAGDPDAHVADKVRRSLREAARKAEATGGLTREALQQWAKQVQHVDNNMHQWSVHHDPEGLGAVAGALADGFTHPLLTNYASVVSANADDVDAIANEWRGHRVEWGHMPAPRWLVEALPTPPPASGIATVRRSPSTAHREESRLLELLKQREGRAFVAGVVECNTALALAEQGKVAIEDPSAITPEGGSGWIHAITPNSNVQPDLTTPEPEPAPDPAPEKGHTGVKEVWFVAHEGNAVPRCTGTSWRGGAGAKAGVGYGPGGFNRCVKEHGHSPEDGGADPMHVDEWGHVFRQNPKFKVVRTLTNAEMAQVARESGMTVGANGQYKSKADALQPNTLWMTADNEMVKLSNVYANEDRVTAQVVFPVPPRTTVRSYTLQSAAAWKPPSAAQMRRYERAWGFDS